MYQFLEQYPYLFAVVLCGVCFYTPFVFGVIVYIVRKGGQFNSKWFDLKGPGSSDSSNQEQSVHVNIPGPTLTEEQIEMLLERITKKAQEIQGSSKNISGILYHPPKLSDRHYYLFEAKKDVEDKVGAIVVTYGGGWAGVSLASYETFFEMAVTHNLIPEKLASDLNDFNLFVHFQMGNKIIDDQMFLEAQYLASNISQQLEWILQRIITERDAQDVVGGF
ncbi:MAG: hypothetical protein AB1846_07695 [Chloroflexota bacterium]